MNDSQANCAATDDESHGALWLGLLEGFPLSGQQQSRCTQVLQSAWKSLDQARYLLDSNTTVKPCETVASDLSRQEIFDETNDLREQYEKLAQSHKVSSTGVKFPEHTQTQQVAQHLKSIEEAIDYLSDECESLDFQISKLSIGTADKLSDLQSRLGPLRKYVQTLEDDEESSQPQATESLEGTSGSNIRGRASTGATALLVAMSLAAGAVVKSSHGITGGEGTSLALW